LYAAICKGQADDPRTGSHLTSRCRPWHAPLGIGLVLVGTVAFAAPQEGQAGPPLSRQSIDWARLQLSALLDQLWVLPFSQWQQMASAMLAATGPRTPGPERELHDAVTLLVAIETGAALPEALPHDPALLREVRRGAMMPLTDDLEVFRLCRRACLEAVRRALDDGGPPLNDAQIGMLLDGADVCETTIRFRRRNSTLNQRLCALCVEILERCVELCGAFAEDAVMRACGEVCGRCAEICRQRAGAGPAAGTPRKQRSSLPWRDAIDDEPGQAERASA